jgi:hypothetical protein
MGQFDSESDAALTQLNYEELSSIPGGEFAEVIGDLLKLIGTGGLWGLTGGISSLALKVRKLAGASYASNLIYAITAVRNDLATLFERHEELRERIEALPTDPKFVEAISVLALRAMHTSVKDRLKRLAHIVVNGVKENDLEPESLDDMMRAAVELKDIDILLLHKIYLSQNPMLGWRNLNSQNWHGSIQGIWRTFVDSGSLNSNEHLAYRSSFSRLESLGLIQRVENAGMYGVGQDLYALLMEGKRFYERVQEIASGMPSQS